MMKLAVAVGSSSNMNPNRRSSKQVVPCFVGWSSPALVPCRIFLDRIHGTYYCARIRAPRLWQQRCRVVRCHLPTPRSSATGHIEPKLGGEEEHMLEQQPTSIFKSKISKFGSLSTATNQIKIGLSPSPNPNIGTKVESSDVPSGDFDFVIFEETYGCFSNLADTQVVIALIQDAFGAKARFTTNEDEANVFLLNTCAIRENAETRVIQRLKQLRTLNKRRKSKAVVCVLGCMAEHMKMKLLEAESPSQRLADIVMGPDAYRELPAALRAVAVRDGSDAFAYNVQLSAEETYAEITPVRNVMGKDGDVSAFISVMRGCDNACSFCVVPRTRGRERSRPMGSILEEIRGLSEQGYKEVVLLGQNVNSYNDRSGLSSLEILQVVTYAPGFETRYPRKDGGKVFAELLHAASDIDPEMRIRFTSPHPKDYPDELISIMSEKPNICKQVHVPAQSGSTSVLQRMRRGYSREAYLDLISQLRERLPGVAVSTDMIVGFCGETEEEHQDSLALFRDAKFEQAFMYAYSERAGTPAAVHMTDDVPESIKSKRLSELVKVFHDVAKEKNLQAEIGKTHLVLVEGPARKFPGHLTGRTDTNKRVVFPDIPVLRGDIMTKIQPGDYVKVVVEDAGSLTLTCTPLCVTTIRSYYSPK